MFMDEEGIFIDETEVDFLYAGFQS